MAKSSKHFQPEARQGKSIVRTLAGVLATLILLAGSLLLLVLTTPAPSSIATVKPAASSYYLSAASGRFYEVSVEEGVVRERVLDLGEDLLPGRKYRCPEGSEALIRSATDEIEARLSAGGTVVFATRDDGVALRFLRGALHLRVDGTPGDEPLVVGAGKVKIKLERPTSALLRYDRDALRVEIFAGSVNLPSREESDVESTFTAGSVLLLGEEGVEVREGVLLPAPEAVEPQPGSVFLRQGALPLPVSFRWHKVPGATRYKAEIARDVLFKQVTNAKLTRGTSLTLADMTEGMYYWRLRALGGGGAHSEPSGPWALTVRKAERGRAEIPAAPSLRLVSLTAQSNLITIRGQTEPGAQVEVSIETDGIVIPNYRKVLVAPDGSFRHQQPVDVRGIITVVVTAYYRPEKVATVRGEVRVDF